MSLTERPWVLNEGQFASVLVRERKRSDRSKQRFGLLLVGVKDGTPAGSPSMLDIAVSALAGVRRETDIVGWFEEEAVLGVIVAEIRDGDLSGGREGLEGRVRRRFVEQLNAGRASRIEVRLHVYPEPMSAGGEGVRPVDPEFYPDLRRRRHESAYEALKRGLDVVGSVTLLVGLSPLFLLVAVVVRLGSRGPVLFRQVRIGQMMKPFTMLKFRTMQCDADHGVHREFVRSFIKANGLVDEPGRERVFKLVGDPRVTGIGRILRNTSLDELPQLWNVLRGQMSLVGPRPPLPYELEQYEPWHRGRVLEAKPGLTGLWQVVGRSRTTFDEMVRLDLQYARTRSLWTDVRILLATPRAVMSGKGAR